jgi:thiamine kinase-like enzyme
MLERQKHQPEVHSYLEKHFPIHDWVFSRPHGSGIETYFIEGNGQQYFVKVGVPLERYVVMAEIGLTPPILSSGYLENGLSIMVQPLVTGRNPSRADYRDQLERVAALVRQMHHHPRLQQVLPPASSSSHRDAGLRALNRLRQTWDRHRAQVPSLVEFVDNSLEEFTLQIDRFSTEGLVASHNDICNANWLFADDGNIFIVDFESMCLDDPAFDMGALLWWYYPPQLRGQFLENAGYPYDHEFKFRMRVRMAMHCLSITLPRQHSFDDFQPERYHERLEDFRAILEGRENPQGYTA